MATLTEQYYKQFKTAENALQEIEKQIAEVKNISPDSMLFEQRRVAKLKVDRLAAMVGRAQNADTEMVQVADYARRLKNGTLGEEAPAGEVGPDGTHEDIPEPQDSPVEFTKEDKEKIEEIERLEYERLKAKFEASK